jgi:trehalose-6-phosphatase
VKLRPVWKKSRRISIYFHYVKLNKNIKVFMAMRRQYDFAMYLGNDNAFMLSVKAANRGVTLEQYIDNNPEEIKAIMDEYAKNPIITSNPFHNEKIQTTKEEEKETP